jgi:hypothetical protein
MKTTLILLSLVLTLPAFAQNICTDLSGTYEYRSMDSQCSMKKAVSPDRYFEGQDSPANWPCQLSWVDAADANDSFIIKNNSKIVVEQQACDSVKIIMESASGKKFACEFNAQTACIGNGYTFVTNLKNQGCNNVIPRNVNDFSAISLTKCDTGLCLATHQLKYVQITPWLGTKKEKVIQCGFAHVE